ncbi:MAG TPA: cation-transporting P-type ATPase [Patescibacteria group bacterium]|nr:cation-transporting P-type ATPase [Patescibacteria group bacterium]
MEKTEVAQLTIQEVFHRLTTSEQGLSSEEVQKRLQQYGENTLKKDKNTVFKIFVKQFTSSLVYLLGLAALLSFFLRDVSDGIVITIVLFFNALLGFVQEYRSEKAIEKLAKLISKQSLVVRDGKTELVDEKLLTIGDIILLREGDIVPADIKLLHADDFSVNESQLTGESVPVTKQAIATNDVALVFAGSIVEKGDAKGVIYAVGNGTELGQIATLSQTTKKITQYEKQLQSFSSFLMRIIFLTLALIFGAKLLITHDFSHITDLLLFIIALSITVIPEALPVIATVTLSEGALRLAKKNVIVKRLSSIEDLGNVNLLCTDKTGTLTENKLSVHQVITDNLDLLQQFAYASIEDLGTKRKKFQNSYDLAFLSYVPKAVQEHAQRWKQIDDLPFDPEARRRWVILEDTKEKVHYLIEIGSVETLLSISTCKEKTEYLHAIEEDGKQGIRHLGIAYKKITYKEDFDILKHEGNLEFLGYVQLIDPLRQTAKHTIELAEKLGVAIKVLTGDSVEVADYVGRQIGLLREHGKVYGGSELAKMSEAEFRKTVEVCNIFARVTPDQKYLIIKYLKENHVVGYQGDGINDAPSLKLADVAIAVNNATDVAKDSADIILLNKDLEVIVNGIHYGRGIFININKYIKHTMVSNFGSFFSLAVLYLISFNLPILPIQLLIGNLMQDLPLISVYSDSVDLNEVKNPQKYNIHSLMFLSLILGAFSMVYNFIYFTMIGFKTTNLTETSLFLFFNLTQLIIILSVRNKGHMWQGKKPSPIILSLIVFFMLLSVVMLYIPPIAKLFSLTALPLSSLLIIFVMTLVYIIALDYIKVLYFKMIQNTIK